MVLHARTSHKIVQKRSDLAEPGSLLGRLRGTTRVHQFVQRFRTTFGFREPSPGNAGNNFGYLGYFVASERSFAFREAFENETSEAPDVTEEREIVGGKEGFRSSPRSDVFEHKGEFLDIIGVAAVQEEEIHVFFQQRSFVKAGYFGQERTTNEHVASSENLKTLNI